MIAPTPIPKSLLKECPKSMLYQNEIIEVVFMSRNKKHARLVNKHAASAKKQNHFAAVRKSSKIVSGLTVSSEDEVTFAFESGQPSFIYMCLIVNGKIVKFQVDRGAAVDVIFTGRINAQQVELCTTLLRIWNGSKVRWAGQNSARIHCSKWTGAFCRVCSRQKRPYSS